MCFIPNSQAQLYEAGVFLGGSNFIGDIGSTTYISPQKPALGLMLKWNRSKRHSFRGSIIFTDLVGFDEDSSDPRRIERDYDFKNSIVEFSAGMEFTFLDFDLDSTDPQMTPYLYTGISTAKHNNSFFRNGIQISENTSSWAIGIPMVAGFKTTISDVFILAAEIGVRYTFSDEIDGSVPGKFTPSGVPGEPSSIVPFGNLNSNDWYVFSGITLTYTFGQKPCCY